MKRSIDSSIGSDSYTDVLHWYSDNYRQMTRTIANNDFQYASHPSVEQMNGSSNVISNVISNDCVLRHEFKSEFKPEFKPQSIYDSKRPLKLSDDCDSDVDRRKRLRTTDPFASPDPMIPDFRLKHANNLQSKGLSYNLFCKSCDSSSHTLHDYSRHLKGRRHEMNLKNTSNERIDEKVCNDLQKLLNKTNEPIVGLDFIEEKKREPLRENEESTYRCNLCWCSNMITNSVYQHIVGFRHLNNYIKLIDSNERRSSDDFEAKPSKKCLAQKYERLYGRGHCLYYRQTLKADKSTVSALNSGSIGKNPEIECKSESNVNKMHSIDKTIEAFKSIRNICDQMIAFYSPNGSEPSVDSKLN